MVGDCGRRAWDRWSRSRRRQVEPRRRVWLRPIAVANLTHAEREKMSAIIGADVPDSIPSVWTDERIRVISTAARDPEVERIFVNPR